MADTASDATLRALLDRSGPLLPEQAVGVIAQVAAALDEAAGTQVMRRDLVDPANIVLTFDGVAYLVDAEQDTGAGVEGLAYLAPERLVHNAPVSVATEVYSLACVLYECLTGFTPYSGSDDLAALIVTKTEAPVPQPSQRLGSVPIGFDEVVARGLAKDPAARFGSAGELAAAARSALQTSFAAALQPASAAPATAMTTPAATPPWPAPVATPPPNPPFADAAANRVPKRRRKALVVLATVLAVVMVAAGVAGVVVWHKLDLPGWASGRTVVFTGTAQAVAADADGNVYLSVGDRVLKRTPGGELSELPFTDLVEPEGLAVDAAGNVYVADYHGFYDEHGQVRDENDPITSRVLKIARGSTTPTELFTFPGDPQRRPQPGCLAVDAAGANVYFLTGDRDATVWRWRAGPAEPVQLPLTGLDKPQGVFVDDADNVYVGDPWRIKKLALNTTTITEINRDFQRSVVTAVDTAGNIYRAPAQPWPPSGLWSGFLIERYSASSAQWDTWKAPRWVTDQTTETTDLATDPAGNLYVVTTTHVWKFSVGK